MAGCDNDDDDDDEDGSGNAEKQITSLLKGIQLMQHQPKLLRDNLEQTRTPAVVLHPQIAGSLPPCIYCLH